MKTATSSKTNAGADLLAARVSFSLAARRLATSLIDRALSSGRLAQGELVATLEKRFSEVSASPYALALNSGTSALEAALLALEVRGRKVIVPANTFVATAAAVINAGGTPVICDIAGPTEPVLDPLQVRNLIDRHTAGVIVVHIGGHIWPQVAELARVCREKDVFLLEDAAHAHGATLDGKPAGSFGRAAAFSLFATKIIASGEGGILVTGDQGLRERAKLYANHGRNNAAELPETAGHNWRMSEVNAAIALAHLSDAPHHQRRRDSAARLYTEALKNGKNLRALTNPEGCRPNWYKFIAMPMNRQERPWFKRRLKVNGISLSGAVFDQPLTDIPALRQYVHCQTPNAESFCRSHICLPIYGDMRKDEASRVSDALGAL